MKKTTLRTVGSSAQLACALTLAVGFVGNGGCGTSTGNPRTGDVELAVQGSKPATTAAARFSMPSLLSMEGPLFGGLSRSAALVSQTTIAVLNSAGVQVGTLTLTDARVALKELELEREESDGGGDEEDESEFPGPYVVNLITNVATPSFDSVKLPAGTYTEIEVKLDKIEGDEDDSAGSPLIPSTDPLFNNSIYLSGTYTGDTSAGPSTATDVPFSMSFDFDETFQLTGPGGTSEGFVVDAGATNPLIIAFRMTKWFGFGNAETNESSVEFSQVVVGVDSSGNPAITLDASATGANDTIRDVIKENIKESADYGEDSDGSGELESDEDDDPDSVDAAEEEEI